MPPITHTRSPNAVAAGNQSGSGSAGAALQLPLSGSKRSTADEGAVPSNPPITQNWRSSAAPATPVRAVGIGAIALQASATASY